MVRKTAVILVGAALAALLWREQDRLLPHAPVLPVAGAAVADAGSGEPVTPLPFPDNQERRKVELGRKLFHDPRLSHDNTISCAHCHALHKGGTDQLARPVGMGGQTGAINAPTVFNSGFNFRQFWDGRAATLEDQIEDPITGAGEMGSNWGEVIAKLQKDKSYVAAFSALYPDGTTPANVKNAIAAFERSLVTPDSRFDKFLRGDKNAITPEEYRGYRLFKDYGCISCHQGMNLGGNMYERLGVMRDYFAERGNIVQADFGRFNVTGEADDKFEFKVPGLRNVALTAPYFHDGSAATLADAVRVMGKYQLGLELPQADVGLIVQFLLTLTGEYQGKPL